MSETRRENPEQPESHASAKGAHGTETDDVDRSLIRDRLSRTELERVRDNQRAARRVARLRAVGRPHG